MLHYSDSTVGIGPTLESPVIAPQVDGSKVRIFATKMAAKSAAASIGWPVKSVVQVSTRFCVAWAIGTGVDHDHYTGLPYLSRERFGELFHARNG